MKKLAVLLALALAAMALVACGDDDEGTTTTDTATEETNGAAAGGEEAGQAGASTLAIEAGPDTGLAYTSNEEAAEAGEVTIEFTNAQSLPHDVAIEGSDGEQLGQTEVITDGEDSTTVELEPGEYTFYCTVPGHREAGMEGTLTVE